MLEKKILFVLLLPILLAVTINGIPQSPADASNDASPQTSEQTNKTETPSNSEQTNKTDTTPTSEQTNKTDTSPTSEQTNKTDTSPTSEQTNKTDTTPTSEQTNKTDTTPTSEKTNKTDTTPNSEQTNKTETTPTSEQTNKTETSPTSQQTNKTETSPTSEQTNKTEKAPPNTAAEPSQTHPPNELRGYNCPKRNGFFRYPEKCDVYIECKDYIPLTYICPEGLQFNSNAGLQELICDDPSVVKCNPDDPDAPAPGGSNQTLVIKVPPGEQNGTPRPILYIANLLNTTYNPTTTTTSRPANVLSGYICPMRNGVFGYPGTCDVYVKCEDNSPLLYKCTDGLQFNPNPRTPELFCDDPSVVNCNALPAVTTQQPSNTPPAPSGFNCPSADGYYKYPGRCDEYFECRVYAPIRSVCPYGLHFDPNARLTDYPCVDPRLVGC